MTAPLNETHDVGLQSWVASANGGESDFPIQNLPFGIFRRRGRQDAFRGGVAIGDQILDLGEALVRNLFTGDAKTAADAAAADTLNALMGLAPRYRIALRSQLSALLREGAARADETKDCLVPQAEAEYALPAAIGDFSDFYSSLHHATNVGRLFRPDNPILPNFKWMPIGYHGRSSSVVVSGHDFPRPVGQTKGPDQTAPEMAPCRRLDYEVELGAFAGPGNALGTPVPIDEAEAHLFGFCILNDWSARDVQAWEYQPLGPFLAKSFLTTISPWVVTMEALAPFRAEWTRPADDPQPLPHLLSAATRAVGAIDIRVEASLHTAKMKAADLPPVRLSSSRFTDAYWTISQIVAHQTSNGCDLHPGDLMGSGTLSGPGPDTLGCLLEQSRGGKEPIELPGGETRTFLEDGDTVTMRAYCQRDGTARIGFGECAGTVLPAGAG